MCLRIISVRPHRSMISVPWLWIIISNIPWDMLVSVEIRISTLKYTPVRPGKIINLNYWYANEEWTPSPLTFYSPWRCDRHKRQYEEHQQIEERKPHRTKQRTCKV